MEEWKTECEENYQHPVHSVDSSFTAFAIEMFLMLHIFLQEFQQMESMLFDVGNEMRQAVAQASAGQQLRSHVEQLQKELVLMGELQQKFRDRFSQLPLLRHSEDEVAHLQDSYHEEIKGLPFNLTLTVND